MFSVFVESVRPTIAPPTAPISKLCQFTSGLCSALKWAENAKQLIINGFCVSDSAILLISTKLKFINLCYLQHTLFPCWLLINLDWIFLETHIYQIHDKNNKSNTMESETKQYIQPINSQIQTRNQHTMIYMFIILRQIELYINNGFVFEPCKV